MTKNDKEKAILIKRNLFFIISNSSKWGIDYSAKYFNNYCYLEIKFI
jgi:hypothetical protein